MEIPFHLIRLHLTGSKTSVLLHQAKVEKKRFSRRNTIGKSLNLVVSLESTELYPA